MIGPRKDLEDWEHSEITQAIQELLSELSRRVIKAEEGLVSRKRERDLPGRGSIGW